MCQDLREIIFRDCSVERHTTVLAETGLAAVMTAKVRLHRNLPKFGPVLRRRASSYTLLSTDALLYFK